MSATSIIRWLPLSLICLLSACEKKLTEDEIMAYNSGWHYAVRIRADGEAAKKEALEGLLKRIPSELHDECREGFSDGLAGKKAKVEIPEKFLKD